MPANIEFKARLRDAAAAHATAARISGSQGELIEQKDVFFAVPTGRLKLRILGPERAELIAYQRADTAAARRSDYRISPVSHPAELAEVLTRALGVVGVVSKQRWLYRFGQTRIHIDRVRGLGDFLEIEVVLRDGRPDEEGHEIARQMLGEFGVSADQLVACAYLDLLPTL
jgi:predicted adenylyl cyclase CyaB